MDRRERNSSGVTALLAAFEGLQSAIWTALPGVITGWDATKQTARILPTIQMRAQNLDGSFRWVTLPELLDCPVHFPKGGGVTLTFPLAIGDECLVVFASRCIDNWWQSGALVNGQLTAQEQAEFRMHDLSDGFCIAGFSSVPKVIADISTTSAQLRSDDGNTFVELDPTAKSITLQTVSEGIINLIGPVNIIGHVQLTGNINQTGSITSSGDITGNGTSLHTHQHSGVSTGGSNTGAPI